MARRADWQIKWERGHNITAREAVVALIAQGATLQKLAFEFECSVRQARAFCMVNGFRPPASVIVLSEEEKARRVAQAKKNLGSKFVAGPPLEVDGRTLTRHSWYKELGGSLSKYYGDEETVRAMIRQRIDHINSGTPLPKRPRADLTVERKQLRAALPYAREAVKHLSESELRQRIRSVLADIAKAKGAYSESREESDQA